MDTDKTSRKAGYGTEESRHPQRSTRSTYGGVLRVINDEDQKVAAAVEKAIPAIARGSGRDRGEASDRRPAVLYRGRNQRTTRRAGCVGVSADLQRAARNGSGHHRRRGSRAHPRDGGKRGRSGSGRAGSAGTGIFRKDALIGIAASGRTPYVLGAIRKARRMGRFDGGNRLHAGIGVGGRGGDRDRGNCRAGDRDGVDTHESRNGHQAGAEHDHYGLHDQAWICVRQSDGERAADERQAARPRSADRSGRVLRWTIKPRRMLWPRQGMFGRRF